MLSRLPSFSPLQRVLVGAGASLGGLVDPWRADLVGVSGEVSGTGALHHMLGRMGAGEEGRQVLRDRPEISDKMIAGLADLPPNTLGHQYHTFMSAQALQPQPAQPGGRSVGRLVRSGW